jgi:cell division protein FtsL
MAALHRPALPAPRAFGRPVSKRWLVTGVVLLGIAAAAMQVNQYSRATSTSYAIDALARERATKQAENQELEAEVAQLASLARVEQDARTRLGLVPAKHTIYLDVNQPAPSRDDAAPAGLQSPAAPPAPKAHHTPLWKRPLKLIPFF